MKKNDRSAAATGSDHARTETFEVTSELVLANLGFGGQEALELPVEMRSAFQRVWHDDTFRWPTSVTVIGIDSVVDAADGSGRAAPDSVGTQISILGTGWHAGTPVNLMLENAFGQTDDIAPLPQAEPSTNGFFGVRVTVPSVPRHRRDFVWDAAHQLRLTAEQHGSDGDVLRASEGELPPHVLWRWVP